MSATKTQTGNSIKLSELNKGTRVKSRFPSVNLTHSIGIYIAAKDGSFTSRQVAQAVYPQNTKITKVETAVVSTLLKQFVVKGKVTRTHVNAVDANNSGQLLYHAVK